MPRFNTDKDTDIYFGTKMEYRVWRWLAKKYPDKKVEWLSTNDKFSTYDFRVGDHFMELKSRRYEKARFDKTRNGHMCEIEKFKYALDHPQYKFTILLFYYDGLYKYNVNRELLEEHITMGDGGRYDRGMAEVKKQAFIKPQYLKKISTKLHVPRPADVCLI